jgi:hypothetical protein
MTRYGAYPVQGTLALDLAGGRPGPPETPELDPSRRSRVEHVADAEVRAWASRLAQGVVETLAGQRPASQLIRWTVPEVYRELEHRARIVARAAPRGARKVRPQVRSIHVCRPGPGTAEVSVHVRHGARSRALALRLERRDTRWLCTVIEFG